MEIRSFPTASTIEDATSDEQRGGQTANLRPASADLRPMSEFDPTKVVLVYDELNDKVFEWNPTDWAGAYNEYAKTHDSKRGVIEWDGLLLAGWKELPDGR